VYKEQENGSHWKYLRYGFLLDKCFEFLTSKDARKDLFIEESDDTSPVHE
jgi:hypothetical protein